MPAPTKRKITKKTKHAAKVGIAAVQLGGRLLNPKNSFKMIRNAIRGKGLVLPGSNYIGPGNPMGRKVKSKGDALAKKHDEDYGRLLDAGYSKKRVYLGFSEADKRLMKQSDTTTPEGLTTYAGMKAKHVMSKTGWTGKRITYADVDRRLKSRAKKK